MTNRRYKINEIFYSLQGEGMYTGFPAIFIRFSGCNRKCSFCDTKHESGEFYTIKKLLEKLAEIKTSCVRLILTGGEPCLQVDTILLHTLHNEGYFIHMETNGDFIPEWIDWIDWITVSPKGPEWKLKEGDELKVVYENQDLEQYFEKAIYFDYLFLQPCSMKNIQECVNKVKEDPRWCLSLQQQKILNIL